MDFEDRVGELERRVSEINAKLDTLLSKENETETRDEGRKPTKEESAREFFLKFNPKKDTEKTLVVISFLEKKGQQSITVREIANAFKEMREPLPPNVSDKIQLLDKRGLLTIAGRKGKRKCWLVSNTGEEYLKRLFDAERT